MFILMCLVGGVSECSPVELMVWWNELKMNEKVIVCVCVGGVEVWNGFFFVWKLCCLCEGKKEMRHVAAVVFRLNLERKKKEMYVVVEFGWRKKKEWNDCPVIGQLFYFFLCVLWGLREKKSEIIYLCLFVCLLDGKMRKNRGNICVIFLGGGFCGKERRLKCGYLFECERKKMECVCLCFVRNF